MYGRCVSEDGGYDEYIHCVDLEARLTRPSFGGPFTQTVRTGKVMICVKWAPILVVFAGKKTRNLQRAHFSLTLTTPLLPATTLSEGECRVSAG